jgi:hypothetical protein
LEGRGGVPDVSIVTFDLHIGVDYSGRETPTSRRPALQVYAAFDAEDPRPIQSPSSTEKTYNNWCRKEIAEWLVEQAQKNHVQQSDSGLAVSVVSDRPLLLQLRHFQEGMRMDVDLYARNTDMNFERNQFPERR